MKSSNVFMIDYNAIESTLNSVNVRLIEEVNLLQKQFVDIALPLRSEDVDRVKSILAKAQSLKGELAKARLSDGRPFSDASKLVKRWFGRFEDGIKTIDRELSRGLVDAERRRRNAVEERQGPAASRVIGVSLSGGSVVRVVADNAGETVDKGSPSDLPAEPIASLTHVPVSFDRSKIDLEELRPYLSEKCILVAIRRYMKTDESEFLDGVEYEERLAESGDTSTRETASKVHKRRSQRVNAGTPWSDAEDAILRDGFGLERPVRELALAHGRTAGAIRARLKKLGLIE